MLDAVSEPGRDAPGFNPPLCTAGLGMIPQAKRVQRSRRKGAPVPEGSIWVGGGSRWANVFARRGYGHAKSVILHKSWLRFELGPLTLERMGFSAGEIATLDRRREWILSHLHELASHDLACGCPLTSQWCHADTYLVLAPLYADYERYAA